MNWVDESIDQYYHWLRERTISKSDETTGWSVVTTPFLGMFNDPIEIYMKMDNSGVIHLSDDGMTLSNLELAGVTISRSPRRKEWVDFILTNYGIQQEGNELVTSATAKDFAQKKHNLICAISEITDMEVMAKNTVAALFKEDVRHFLDEQEIVYTPQFITKGSSGLEFTFDFQIAGRSKEMVIKSFNTLNKINVPNFLFSWNDIKETREKVSGKELLGLAFINDDEKEIKEEYINALEIKGAKCVLWTKRNTPESKEKLREAA